MIRQLLIGAYAVTLLVLSVTAGNAFAPWIGAAVAFAAVTVPGGLLLTSHMQEQQLDRMVTRSRATSRVGSDDDGPPPFPSQQG